MEINISPKIYTKLVNSFRETLEESKVMQRTPKLKEEAWLTPLLQMTLHCVNELSQYVSG